MARSRAALAPFAAGAAAVALLSGGSSADPRTPPALPGLPPPFLGTAVVGSGELTAAVDSYGNVVDLRPGPVGPALIDEPAVIDGAGALPLWRADRVQQRYRPGTNVLAVRAWFGGSTVTVVYAAPGGGLACWILRDHGWQGRTQAPIAADEASGSGLRCGGRRVARTIRSAERSDRRWLARARPLGRRAPRRARGMYRRSLLTLRALSDRRTGAVAAGAREGWAYVWPRDAGAAALAFAAAGYRPEARRVARFLLDLDLGAAARFHGDGSPVDGREAQGDAAGWAAVAARAAGLVPDTRGARVPAGATTLSGGAAFAWRDRADYWEGEAGDYLGNAIAAGATNGGASSDMDEFAAAEGLVRAAEDPGSGLDSAAAWAVRPFPQPAFFPAARRTLLTLAGERTRFGIVPGQGWDGADPWTAPTAWTAWGLAALGDRRPALRLLASLRRAATPAGALPERVDVHTGVPTSTTPLAWSHAFAVLALRELWP